MRTFLEQPRAVIEEDGKKWERQEMKGRKPKDEINGGMTSYKIGYIRFNLMLVMTQQAADSTEHFQK
jgi:hypothetical protein